MIVRSGAIRRVLIFVTIALLCAGHALATQDAGPFLPPLQAFTTAFNHGQREFPAHTFLEDATTIDEFAPYSWSGPNAARIWYRATTGGNTDSSYKAFMAAHEFLTLGTPVTVRQRGTNAFVVISTKLTFQARGSTHLQHLYWTVSETETSAGWRIAAQAWALIDDTIVK